MLNLLHSPLIYIDNDDFVYSNDPKDWDSQEDLAKLRYLYGFYNPRYSCKQFGCVPDPQGMFEIKEYCDKACKSNYECNPWRGCIESIRGKYNSQSECEAKCSGFNCDMSKGCVSGDYYYTDKNDCKSFACRLYDSTYLQSPTKPITCSKKNNIYGLFNGINKDGYFYFSDMENCKKQTHCTNWTCSDSDNCTCADA